MTAKPTYEQLEQQLRELQQDASDRKRVEAVLRESETKYRTLVENIQDGVFVLQGDAIIFANEALAQMSGYSVKELTEMGFSRCIAPEDVDFVMDRYQRRQAGERIPGEYELHMLHKDGRSRIAVNINVGIIQYEGEVASIGTVKNITERKQAEAALRESEEQFRLFFQTMPDAVTIIRAADGVVLDINEGFCNLTGWLREEVIGMTAKDADIWVNPQDRERFIDQISKHGQTQNIEAQFRLKNGDIISGLFSAKLITLHGAPHIITNTRDISELKKAQKDKEVLEAQLRQAHKMEAIGTLAGGIAHDFNNILAALMGYTEMAQFDIPETNPARQNLDQALKAAHRARDLVKHILAFSRQTEHELQPVWLHVIVEDALQLIRASLPTTIEIYQDLSQESDIILADSIQIHQVVMNLCSNAHQAMQEKGGALYITLKPMELKDQKIALYPELESGSYLNLTIKDTGSGMAPDILERIFDPYFTTKDRGKGTGLGLAVVHGIISDHGGSIYVESQENKGTTFDIFLPRLDADITLQSKPDMSFPMGNERILFADDEESLVELAGIMLARFGYQVVTTSSSLEALAMFSAEPERFDLVITDMAMPKMAGDELAMKIMKIRPDIPVIICTGYSNMIDRAGAEAIGIASFLMKPLTAKDLSMTVRQVLDNRVALIT